jgi:sulfur carrier protein
VIAEIELTLNGEPRRLPAGATLAAAVREAGAGTGTGERGIAVALDGEVVPRGQWERQPLRDGQRVEVVQAVQGG